MKKFNNTVETNLPLRLVAYIRKSSEDNKDGDAKKQLNSLAYQRTFINDTVQREGYTLLRTFEDDKTGYEAFIRPQFEEMLTYLKEHSNEVDGIICTEISRLARNFGDGGMILWYMQSNIINKIITLGKTFTNSSTDQMMVAIEFAMSKKSSDDTGLRTIEGMRSKAHTMKHPSRPPVLGYKTIGDVGAKKWVVDPKTAPLVEKVFQTFSGGDYDFREIAEYASSIGLSSTDRKSRTNKISANTWRNRLIDIKYTGIFEHEEERIAGDYEPIISSELFYQVQEVINGHGHPKIHHMDYAYTGLVNCSLCGSPLSATHKKGNTYYRCGKKKAPCKDIGRITYINEIDLENDLLTAFENMELDHEMWLQARKYVSEINQPEKAELTSQVRVIQGKIDQEDKMQTEIGRKFMTREISKGQHDKLIKDSEEKQLTLRATLLKCENAKKELDHLMYAILDDIKLITKRLRVAEPANKRAMVEIFCENMSWKDEKLRWDWKKPYYLLVKQNKNSSVLPD